VDVPGAAVGGVRHLEPLDPLRGVDEAGSAGLHLGVSRVGEQRRRPADLELEADFDEEVGALQFQQVRRLGVDEVRILEAGGDRRDLDARAADLARDGGEVGGVVTT
jgi:hypothetical protein